jgi:recombinational DNA repair protein RecR
MTRLPLHLPLRCQCGHVGGIASNVSPSSGFRFVYYCKDCQASSAPRTCTSCRSTRRKTRHRLIQSSSKHVWQ